MNVLIKVMTYQQTKVVRPQPFVLRYNLPQPRWLVDCFLGWHTNVRHSRIRQSERHTDPLAKRRKSQNTFVLCFKFNNVLNLSQLTMARLNINGSFSTHISKVTGGVEVCPEHWNSPSPQRYRTAGPHLCMQQSRVLQQVCRRSLSGLRSPPTCWCLCPQSHSEWPLQGTVSSGSLNTWGHFKTFTHLNDLVQ